MFRVWGVSLREGWWGQSYGQMVQKKSEFWFRRNNGWPKH